MYSNKIRNYGLVCACSRSHHIIVSLISLVIFEISLA